MPTYYALVDAMPGREREVDEGLRKEKRLAAVVPCRERSHDFLVRFDAPEFGVVDDLLQSHVRHIPGVKGVEIILDWDDHGSDAREARVVIDRLVPQT